MGVVNNYGWGEGFERGDPWNILDNLWSLPNFWRFTGGPRKLLELFYLMGGGGGRSTIFFHTFQCGLWKIFMCLRKGWKLLPSWNISPLLVRNCMYVFTLPFNKEQLIQYLYLLSRQGKHCVREFNEEELFIFVLFFQKENIPIKSIYHTPQSRINHICMLYCINILYTLFDDFHKIIIKI